MSWATVADALGKLVATADPDARVLLGDRLVRTSREVLDLFATPRSGSLSPLEIRAWVITRDAIDEEPIDNAQNLAREEWGLRCVHGFDAARDSERDHQERIDAVLAAIRAADTVGEAGVWSCGQATEVEIGELRELRVHTAQLTVTTQELVTTSSTGPTIVESARRSVYSDVAGEIAGLLAGVEGHPRVHPRRQYAVTDEDTIDLWTTQAAELGELQEVPSARAVRGWQLWRTGAGEERGLGSLSELSESYAVQCFWGWQDGVRSYEAFQAHLDAARAVLRARPELGNPANRTRSISSPLRVKGITGVRVGGYAAHFADCELALEVGCVA